MAIGTAYEGTQARIELAGRGLTCVVKSPPLVATPPTIRQIHPVDQREQNEIERSAAEARDIVLRQVQVDRYLDPPSDTAYPLEYAYNLLNNVQGKTVLDLGCGSGENVIVLVQRGAQVIGIDISPDLIDLAKRRAQEAGIVADLRVRSAYDTGLPDHSVDVIFCIALIHHLDILRVQREMARILREGGYIVLKEPILFSNTYDRFRKLFPARMNVSNYEHPLSSGEFKSLTQGYFVCSNARFFRLPFIPLLSHVFSRVPDSAWRASNWIINSFPFATSYASIVVTQLRAKQEVLRRIEAA